jgi:hypothetical protein
MSPRNDSPELVRPLEVYGDMRARAALIFAFFIGTGAFASSPQERVHDMSHSVMPFDMKKTLHVFRMTEQGGVQKVIARDDSDQDQVAMIRRHLEHEAEAFGKGDYGDPGHLHGATMPGLAEIKANAARIRVTYSELPNGAALTFDATDLHTITAIHRWFGAQLSEHGADAQAE